MSRSSFASFLRAKPTLATGRNRHQLFVESLEERRLLSVSGSSVGSYQPLVDYYRGFFASNSSPYRTLDSLLNREVEPIVKCPGLRDAFCLPDTVSPRKVDEAMGKDVGLDDDWFSIDKRKRSLLDVGGLKNNSLLRRY